MTHVVHPYSYRLAHIRDWRARWFQRKHYAAILKEDILLYEWLTKRLRGHYVESIDIERSAHQIHVIIRTSRPGLLIGRRGEGIELLRKDIATRFPEQKGARLSVEEVRYPEAHARIVAQMIAYDLQKRLPFRRILKQVADRVMSQQQVQGVRIELAGRLDGAEMGRREWTRQGRIPLQTIRADIDFARERALLPYGTIGIKVWIYKGEIFNK
jgi:small subunit ribosomal protein S3